MKKQIFPTSGAALALRFCAKRVERTTTGGISPPLLRLCLLCLCLFFFALLSGTAPALEYIHFRHQGGERNEEGRIILDDTELIVLEARDGQYYAITPRRLLSRKSDEVPFEPYSKAEMIERLKKEFPPQEGYYYSDIYGPFIVVYTTERAFANWYGGLLERLHTLYVQHWKRLGVELNKPEFPLVAIVLSSEERYRQYAKQENIPLFSEQSAFYHKMTNRIVMYDITGQQALREGIQRRATAADVRRFLSDPRALSNVTAVIHEAVHQVGFNTGMHPRYSPSPMWLYEGLAVFHEVPDLRHQSGWTLGPHINRSRLLTLRQYLARPYVELPIQNMIKDDQLFRKQETALDNYALAWGVTYYLARVRPKELAAYLKLHQEKPADAADSSAIRIKDFETCFGSDWDAFYRDFANYIRKL